MSSKNVELKVTSKKSNGVETWEGTVSIQGTKPTKLVQKSGSAQFSTRASVLSAARYLGTRIGATVTEASAKKAAKKSVTAKKSSKAKTASSTSARTSPPAPQN